MNKEVKFGFTNAEDETNIISENIKSNLVHNDRNRIILRRPRMCYSNVRLTSIIGSHDSPKMDSFKVPSIDATMIPNNETQRNSPVQLKIKKNSRHSSIKLNLESLKKEQGKLQSPPLIELGFKRIDSIELKKNLHKNIPPSRKIEDYSPTSSDRRNDSYIKLINRRSSSKIMPNFGPVSFSRFVDSPSEPRDDNHKKAMSKLLRIKSNSPRLNTESEYMTIYRFFKNCPMIKQDENKNLESQEFARMSIMKSSYYQNNYCSKKINDKKIEILKNSVLLSTLFNDSKVKEDIQTQFFKKIGQKKRIRHRPSIIRSIEFLNA